MKIFVNTNPLHIFCQLTFALSRNEHFQIMRKLWLSVLNRLPWIYTGEYQEQEICTFLIIYVYYFNGSHTVRMNHTHHRNF